MAVTIQCPNTQCRAMATVAETLNGRKVKCRRCGTPFVARPTVAGQPAQTSAGQPSAQADDPFPNLPAAFGRYRVLRLLGKGGMGAVYLAEDTQLGRRVALKLPSFDASASPQRVERFLREARSAAALHHPNICTLYDAGREAGRPFLTMAYIQGQSLADVLDDGRRMPPGQAVELIRKIALALGHAHETGIVHRDLKPANVMVTAAGEPVIMDFGLAKRLADSDAQEAKLTREGAVLGTPTYMAPEQVRAETEGIGPHTDVYALGVMLFEMLTGQAPYLGPVTAILGQILGAPVPLARQVRPDVDVRLEAICQRAMAKEPRERFASMAAFAAALDGFPHKAAVPAQAVQPFENLDRSEPPVLTAKRRPPRRSPRRSRGPLWIAVGAAGLVVLLATLGVVLLTVRTKHGNVVIEPSNPAARVDVKVDGDRPLAADPSPKEPPAGTTQPPPPPAPPAEEWISLFNGKDLTGWTAARGDANAWMVKEGDLVGISPAGPQERWLLTEQDFDSFVLRFEYRLRAAARASSGITFRALPTDPLLRAVKLMDDSDRGDWEVKNGERTGSVWAQAVLARPQRNATLRPAGEWNEAELTVNGKSLTLAINGEQVQHLDLSEFAKQAGDFPTLTRASGRLGLQVHTSIVRFRNLRLKKLPAAAANAPKAPTAKAELRQLGELPHRMRKRGMWLSPDGLTLYWSSTLGRELRTWVATRPNADARFANVAELFAGCDPTVTADGLEMILAGSDEAGALAVSTRASTRGPWGQPRKLAEFDGLGALASPCLAGDGLTLYAELFGANRLGTTVRFRRPDRKAPWGRPEPLTITGLPSQHVRFPYVTDDGRFLFGRFGGAHTSPMVLLTSTDGGKTFGTPAAIDVPGINAAGRYPRYVSATKELFFCGDTPGQTLIKMFVIRNFDPGTMVKPLP
jgi:serine/threonine protein kinase